MQGTHAHPFGFWTYAHHGDPLRHEDDGLGDELGGGAGLGTPPGWFNSLVSLVPGGTNKVAEFENYLRAEAKAGAEQAIPTIKAEVTKTAKPFVIGAVVLGLGGFLFGLGALRVARSK